MEILASVNIPYMFESIILETGYSAEYTTIYHHRCNFTFGGSWERKYHASAGYITGAKHYVCPKCGRYSLGRLDYIYLAYNENDKIPISLYMDVVAFKDFIDIRIKCKSITLRTNGTHIVNDPFKQTVRFDFKKKKAFFMDSSTGLKVELTHKRLDDMSPLPLLEYLAQSSAMNNTTKRQIDNLFKVLRLEFEKRVQAAYGFKCKDVYIPNSMKDSDGYGAAQLTNMVYKLSAPDMPNIRTLAVSDRRWSKNYYDMHFRLPFDDSVFELTRKGMNFQEALRMVYLAPDNRLLRRIMIYDPLIVRMAPIMSFFKDTNCLNRLLRHAEQKPYVFHFKIAWTKDLLPIISKMYPENVLVNYLISHDMRDINDTANMIGKLSPENKAKLDFINCKIGEIHDVVMDMYDKQEYIDVRLPTQKRLQFNVDGFNFVMPGTAYDLRKVGSELKNCVGSYKERVLEKASAIVVVTNDDGTPVACLELQKSMTGKKAIFDQLVQAKVFANKSVSTNKDVNMAVMHWANQLKIEPTTIDVDAQVS